MSFCPPPPLPLSVLSLSVLSRCVDSWGFAPPGPLGHSGGVGSLRQLESPAHTVAPPPWGFLPLWRSRGPPPPPPLCGTQRSLQRPCYPLCFPALPRLRLPHFSAGLRLIPLAPASPHGGPTFPPCRRPQRGFPGVAPVVLHCNLYTSRADFLRASWRRCQRVYAPPWILLGHPVLLHLLGRAPLTPAAPPQSLGIAIPLVIPAALPPVSVTDHLFIVAPLSMLLLCRCPPPHGCPPPRICLAERPFPSIPLPSSLSCSYTTPPRALAAARPYPRAPSPGPSRQYCW